MTIKEIVTQNRKNAKQIKLTKKEEVNGFLKKLSENSPNDGNSKSNTPTSQKQSQLIGSTTSKSIYTIIMFNSL